MLQCD